MESIKAVVTDLDGSLLGSDKYIHPRDVATMKTLKEKGVHLFFATGRHVNLVFCYAREIGCLDQGFTANGACTYDFADNKIVEAHFLTPEQIQRIGAFSRRHNVPYFVYTRDYPYYLRRDHRIDPVKKSFVAGAGPVFVEEIRLMDEFADFLTEPVLKITLQGLTPRQMDCVEEEFPDCGLELYRGKNLAAEIGPKGCSKGAALAKAARAYGFSLEDVLAIGDNFNDFSLLKDVGFPVAPRNSQPELLPCARYVCADNNDAPLTDAILHFQPELLS